MSRRPPSDSRRPAFTLPEILAVLALVALVAGIVATDADALHAAFRSRSPADMARRAFSRARARALETHAPVILRVSDRVWRLSDADGAPAGTFEITAKDDPRRMTPIAGSGENAADAPALPEVRFSPEGISEPVRVRLSPRPAGPVRVWRVEPFSAILTEVAE